MIIYWLIPLLVAVSARLSQLTSNEKNTLSVDQYLYSREGEYRMKLNSDCKLQRERYTSKGYQKVDQVQNTGNSCSSLSLTTNSLKNNNGYQYGKLSQPNSLSKFYLSNEGVPKISGEKQDGTLEIQDLASPINSNSQFQRSFDSVPLNKPIRNLNGWNFDFNGNDATIQKGNIKKTVDTRGLKEPQGLVTDRENQNRYALLPGMTLHPRADNFYSCPNPNFQDYYLDIDPYYPYARIKDNLGYQIGEIGLDLPKGYPSRVCPKYTFRYKNDCQYTCPQDFIKEVRGNEGRCVQNCEQGSKFSQKETVCTSVNYPAPDLPDLNKTNITKNELGYFCTGDKQFFNQITQQCTKECPAGYFALTTPEKYGVCTNCPKNCQKCARDSELNRNYLMCEQCADGYSVNSNGQCQLACNIENCAQCSGKQCQRCAPMYLLRAGECTPNCQQSELPVLTQSGQLYCPKIPTNNRDNFIGGVYDGKNYTFIRNCPSGRLIHNNGCVNSCPDSFINIAGVCACNATSSPYYNLGGECRLVKKKPNGMYYHPKYHTYFNCEPGCLECEYERCLKCMPDSVLFITKTQTFCQKMSPFFNCNPKYYTYDTTNRICSYKQSNSDYCSKEFNLGNCRNCVKKSVLTSNGQNGICIQCNSNFIAHFGICVPANSTCSDGEYLDNGRCVPKETSCAEQRRRQEPTYYPFNSDFIKSDSYNAYSKNGTSISGNPIQQNMYIRDQMYGENPSNYQSYGSIIEGTYQCQKCVSSGYKLINGKCVSQSLCPDLSKRFFDEKLQECRSSCVEDKIPQLQNATIYCRYENETTSKKEMKIDSSVYPLRNGKYLYYFVIDAILNDTDVSANIIEKPRIPSQQVSQGLELAETPTVAQFKNRTYIALETFSDEVALDFTGSLEKMVGIDGQLLGSGTYGVSANKNHLDYQSKWLAIVAYILSLLTIMLHAIYIGNYLLYKVDNLLIFVQCIWYFLFIKIFVGHTLAQYYWGFSWSHWEFFPNFFRQTIPNDYYEGYDSVNNGEEYLSNSYRLATGDANFIRNAGFSFSLLITFILGFIAVLILIWLLKKCCKKSELWYYKIAKQAMLAAVEFVSFNVMYWAIAHLRYNLHPFEEMYPNQPENHVQFRKDCSVAAIIFVILIPLYMFVRWFFHKYGGLYMLKRICYAAILAGSVHQFIQKQGSDYNLEFTTKQALVIAMVVFELIFMILRFLIEKPQHKRQKFFIIAEAVCMMIAFIIMYVWNDTGVVSVFVSIFIFVFLLFLIEDLIDVYNDARDEFYDEDVGVVPGAMQKPPPPPDSERQALRS